jgi:hypothetical protein
MARKKTVKLTMINNSICYVPEDEFNSAGVPESPDSVIGNYIKGSRGPMLRVNAMEDMSGKSYFVNPRMIVDMEVIYL